jgi:hypothetical protein
LIVAVIEGTAKLPVKFTVAVRVAVYDISGDAMVLAGFATYLM